jgi:hypothetical protein
MMLLAHVQHIADTNGITILFGYDVMPRATPNKRLVRTWPITTDVLPLRLVTRPAQLLQALPDLLPDTNLDFRYATAMHELGHVVTHDASLPRYDREILAWQWARRNALYWTSAMQASRDYSRQSHEWRRLECAA